MRGAIAAELIGNQTPGLTPLPFHQLAKKPLSGTSITASLDQDIEYVTILIDGAPEILLLPADLRADGPAVFERFNAPAEDTLWGTVTLTTAGHRSARQSVA